MAGQSYTTRSIPVSLRSNAGGLNSTGSPLSLKINESSDLQNVEFSQFGSIKKRKGYTQLNTVAFNSGATFVGLDWFELSTGTDFLVGVAGDKVAKMDNLDGTWDDITGGITITAGDNNHVDFATHVDTLLMTNGVDAPWQWTGTGNAAAMTVPTGLTVAKYVEVFSNYTFLGNVTVSGTAHPSRVYWSAIDSVSSWNSADFRDVSKNDGQVITGLQTLGETLVIFKERSIWIALFTGDADIPFTFTKTRSNVGCIAGGSVTPAENGIIFQSCDGFYFFDGQSSFKISDRVTTTIDGFNANRFTNSVATYSDEKNLYIASFTTSGNSEHNRNLTWDSFNNAWSLYNGIAANTFARVFTSGEERIYFGDYDGFVYRLFDGNNDNPSGVSTAIDAYYYTKWLDYDDLITQKATPEVKIYYQFTDGDLDFAYSFNFNSSDEFTQTFDMSVSGSTYGSGLYGTATYGATGGALVRRDLTGRGEVIRMKFANNKIDETFTVDGFGAFPHGETND